ncbi:MAG: hypothetical protein FWD01_00430 [Defluviitaleaceae bacterium]|nr:hypothetical protein [Defluviitaleaceae bacterium]
MNYDNNNQNHGKSEGNVERDDYKYDIRFDNVAPPKSVISSRPIRKPSRLILFLLMWIPGLGHMYMGLIRRGLFYMSALPLLIYFTVALSRIAPIFTILTGFSIAALYFVSFFETFVIRRDIMAGKEIADIIPDLRSLLKIKIYGFPVVIPIFTVVVVIGIISILPRIAVFIVSAIASYLIGRYVHKVIISKGEAKSNPKDVENNDNTDNE